MSCCCFPKICITLIYLFFRGRKEGYLLPKKSNFSSSWVRDLSHTKSEKKRPTKPLPNQCCLQGVHFLPHFIGIQAWSSSMVNKTGGGMRHLWCQGIFPLVLCRNKAIWCFFWTVFVPRCWQPCPKPSALVRSCLHSLMNAWITVDRPTHHHLLLLHFSNNSTKDKIVPPHDRRGCREKTQQKRRFSFSKSPLRECRVWNLPKAPF